MSLSKQYGSMMNKSYTLALIIILSSTAFSAEKAPNCISEKKTTDGPLANLDKTLTSCGYMEGLTNLKGQKEVHQKAIYEKLSNQLSKKINQNSEETALLTNYFYSNGADLSMNNSEVKKSCNLPSLKNIETCGGKKQKGAFFEMKLNALTKSLNPSGVKSKLGDGLYGILADKYVKNMGIANLDNKQKNLQCPLDGGVSAFILSSQLDELSAQDIINGATTSDGAFASRFNSYAQLKFLKSAGKEAVAEFKKYVLEKSKNKDISSKDYIAKFFLREDIQKKYLAPTLAKQCESINDNINRFLCEDLTELGSTDSEVSTKMFNGLDIGPINDQFGVDTTNMDTMTAYGFQCLAHEKKKGPVDKYASKEKEEKLDDWYNDFTINTRPEISDDKELDKNKNFCALYLCSSEKAQTAPSCKNGGPILSSDLSKIFGCGLDPRSDECKAETLKSIDYLASIEKIKTSSGFKPGSLSSSPRAEDVKKALSILPDFAANYLGVEGTLKALGLPLNLAEVTKDDFKVRNLETTPPPYQPPTSNHTEYAKNDSVEPSYDSVPSVPYVTNTPVSSVPIIPSSSKASSSYKKIEGIHGKTKVETNDDSNNPFGTKKEVGEIQKKIIEIPQVESTATNNSISSEQKNYSSIERELENKFKSGERSLEDRRRLADLRDADYWARVQELERKESEFRESRIKNGNSEEKNTPKNSSKDGGSSLSREDAKKGIDKLKREIASDVSASSAGIIVTPEKLDKLEKKDLKNYGVDIEEPFIISIRMKGKLIHVRVAKVKMNNKTFLAPRLDEDNKEITEVILKSPIFKEFRYYYDKKNASYFPIK